MRTLKIIPISPDKPDFTYSLEPGAEVLGTNSLGILVMCDPDEPSTIKHRFIIAKIDIKFEDSEFKITPEEALIYIGACSPSFHIFEVD